MTTSPNFSEKNRLNADIRVPVADQLIHIMFCLFWSIVGGFFGGWLTFLVIESLSPLGIERVWKESVGVASISLTPIGAYLFGTIIYRVLQSLVQDKSLVEGLRSRWRLLCYNAAGIVVGSTIGTAIAIGVQVCVRNRIPGEPSSSPAPFIVAMFFVPLLTGLGQRIGHQLCLSRQLKVELVIFILLTLFGCWIAEP